MGDKVRGPTDKTIVRAYYENNRISLKKVAEKFDIPYNTVKSWKSRDTKDGLPWVQPKDATQPIKEKEVATPQNRRQALSKAKAMVIAGETIEKASSETGIPKGTLDNYSSKEKWVGSRKAYNEYIYKEMIDELGKQHLEDRKNALKISRVIAIKVYNEMQKGELDAGKLRIYKDVADIVEKTITMAGKLMGVKDIDRVQFGEFEDDDVDDDNNELIIKVVD